LISAPYQQTLGKKAFFGGGWFNILFLNEKNTLMAPGVLAAPEKKNVCAFAADRGRDIHKPMSLDFLVDILR
jgi:hypothetical protein